MWTCLCRVGEATTPGPPQQSVETGLSLLPSSSTSARPIGIANNGRRDGPVSAEGCIEADDSEGTGCALLPSSSTSAQLCEPAIFGRRAHSVTSVSSREDAGSGDEQQGFCEPVETLDPGEAIHWSLGCPGGGIVGTCNPSGVANKLHIFGSFTPGWFSVCETQATARIQKQFNAAVKKPASKHGFYAVHSAPAPLRPGSIQAGSWTGTSQFNSSPLRQVNINWPSDEFSSGRVCIAAGKLQGLPITLASVYLPPDGPTYPRARALRELLLEPLSKELVVGRGGCRAIVGDFNCSPGSLVAQQLWTDCGWVEIQDEMSRRHGLPPFNTCKEASRVDQVWISPELARFLVDVGWADMFPDHKLLTARFRIPDGDDKQWFWQQPQGLPWHSVDKKLVADKYDALPGLDLETDPSDALRAWAKKFERAVKESVTNTEDCPSSCLGRCQVRGPRLRNSAVQVPKHSREGDFQVHDSFLGRACQLWFQQLRRLESLLRNARKNSQSEEAAQERSLVWQRVLQAKGFQHRFDLWWMRRPLQLQGAPETLDRRVPDAQSLELIVADFKQNYDRFASWHSSRRQRVIKARWQEKQDSCFRVVRPNPREQLETLVDTFDQRIEVCDASCQYVRVETAFPTEGILRWTLNKIPAVVRQVDDRVYEVDSDLVLCDGQILSCKILVDEISQIQDRLVALWNGRWGQHAGVPQDHWQRICSFAARFLPRLELHLQPVSYEQWVASAKTFKLKAARGPDGLSREDILSMPRVVTEELLIIFSKIEGGSLWPSQWLKALVVCLEKHAGAETVNDYRPITLLSIAYRCWASARTNQLLTHLSKMRAPHQCGFTQDCMPADIWFWIQSGIEASIASGGSKCGIVADIVKCYNCIPRQPLWPLLQCLGIPSFFTHCWSRFLDGLQRSFVIRQSVGPVAASTCGYPEGCPLSCAAMTALDIAWHCWQTHYAPSARALSFVDNLEVTGSGPLEAVQGLAAMRSFCESVSLQLDEAKLYGWATDRKGRQGLEAFGVRTILEARDLGGQVTYCSKHFIHVLADRIAGIKPCFAALRRSGLCLWDKHKCIVGAIWPKGLHGCEAVIVGAQHFAMLRSGVMRACCWDLPGSSAWVRVGLIHADRLDPFFYQLWRCLWMFCRQCSRSYEIRHAWQTFCFGASTRRTQGPFSKLKGLCRDLGWDITHDLRLQLPGGLEVSILDIPQTGLRRLALYFWRQTVSTKVAERSSLSDLKGYEAQHSDLLDGQLSSFETDLLHKVRDGTHYTRDCIANFASGGSACPHCGCPDSREHRYFECVHYSDLREDLQIDPDFWWSCDAHLALHGLVGRNPYKILFWKALEALHLTGSSFRFEPPLEQNRHVFTDGSGIEQRNADLALAAWSLVHESSGEIIAAGGLPGLVQSVPRAEAYAVLMTVRWAANEQDVTHIWSDSQNTVETFRCIQAGDGSFEHGDNADIWQQIADELDHAAGLFRIHKVPGHMSEEECDSPFLDWCRTNNSKADIAAKFANASRPSWFATLYARYRDRWTQDDASFRKMSALHLAVAKRDVESRPEPQQGLENSVEDPLDFCYFDRSVRDLECTETFEAHSEGLHLNWFAQLPGDPLIRPEFVSRLLDFLIGLEGVSNRWCLVTFVELSVVFRQFIGCDLVSSASDQPPNRWIQHTLAAERRVFRKAFWQLCSALDLKPETGWVDLGSIGFSACCESVRICYPVEAERFAVSLLKKFASGRPVRSAQALARPLPV